MSRSNKTIAIVGLGLIGGSLAGALMELRGGAHSGDRPPAGDSGLRPGPRPRPRSHPGHGGGAGRADVTVLCATPQGIMDLLEEYHDHFKPGSLVTDVCGVKTAVLEKAKLLPPSVDFIGSHPMAGTEFAGIRARSAHGVPGQQLDHGPPA